MRRARYPAGYNRSSSCSNRTACGHTDRFHRAANASSDRYAHRDCFINANANRIPNTDGISYAKGTHHVLQLCGFDLV